MSGGNVSGNYASSGGGVLVKGRRSTFNMTGGNVSGNRAYQGGSGVKLESGGSFTMSGGSVSGNIAWEGGMCVDDGSISLSGSPVITGNKADEKANNVYLKDGKIITVTGKLTDTASVGVTMASPGVFTSGLNDYGTAENFKSDNPDYAVGLLNGEAALCALHAVTVPTGLTGGSVAADKARAIEG